ncbi:hypothetical protein K3495_g11401 [Podosphaera aphanis]|nr:hypothetical protein K3495_g11401 [Podosphaera aphanis]
MLDINKNTGSPNFACLAAMLKAFDDGFARQAHQNIELSEKYTILNKQNIELSETNSILNTRVCQKIVVINEVENVLKSPPAAALMPQVPIHFCRISTDPDKFDGESDVTKRQQSYVNWKPQLRKTADQLFAALDSQYESVNLKLDASIKFDKLFQRKTPYPNFLATFQGLATRCGKTEEQKVEALKKKVSDEIAQQFRSLDEPPASDDFAGWVAKGSRFYENIQEYNHTLRNKGEGNRPHQNYSDRSNPPAKSGLPISEGGDKMDLDQATLFKLTDKEKNIRRENNLCFYCHEQGHSIGEREKKWLSDNKASYRDSSSQGTRGSHGTFQMPRGNFNHGSHNGLGWAQAVQGNWRGS